jgi:hypothetical protein
MVANDTDWCDECFLGIETSDMDEFSETGLCKSCSQKYTKHNPETRRKNQSQNQNIGVSALDNNDWTVVVAALFILPPVDFFFFGSSLPYGYFIFLRLVAFVSMVFLTYLAARSGKKIFDIEYRFIFGGCALLYNPFLPIELTREIWTVFNCATAGTLIHYNFYAKVMEPDAKSSVDYSREQTNFDDQLGSSDSLKVQALQTDHPDPAEDDYVDTDPDPVLENELDDEEGVSSFFDFFGSEHYPQVEGLRSYMLRAFGSSNLSDLPKNFQQDRYVAGLATGYFAIVIDAVKDGLGWSVERRGQYATDFFSELFYDDDALNCKVLRDKKLAFELSSCPNFQEGREHGNLLAAVHYDLLKDDLSDPLIDACRNLSRSSSGLDMPTAVLALTLQKYVLSEWPNSILGSN